MENVIDVTLNTALFCITLIFKSVPRFSSIRMVVGQSLCPTIKCTGNLLTEAGCLLPNKDPILKIPQTQFTTTFNAQLK